jgi:PAS domain S-box-containing protein
MYLDLIKNVSLLIALANIYSLLARIKIDGRRSVKILMGLLFGAGAIAGMLLPFKYASGIFYDGRSIILTLAGLFGGGTTAIVSIIVAGAYRASLGGNGMWAGLATIISCAMVGLAFRRIRKNHPGNFTLPELFAIGVVAHIAMLASQLLVLPWPTGLTILKQIWLPVMLIFPAATLLIGLLYKNEDRRIQTERKLESSEALYHDLVDSAQTLIWQCDMEGRYTYLNPAWEEVFGYKIEEMSGKKFTDFQTPEFAERDFREFSKLLQGTPVKDLETVYLSKDGGEIHLVFNAKMLIDESGNPSGTSGTAYDITERKKTGERLIENERKLSEAQAMSRLGFWTWDVKSGDVEWSDEVYKIFRLDPEEFTPQIDSIQALSPWPEQHQRDKELINKAIKSKSPGNYEQMFLRPDKSIGYYYSTFQGKYDDNGDLITIIGTVLDITERKQAEQELEASIKREKELADIVRDAPIAIAFGYPDGRLENCNDAFSELTGYSIAELQQINWNEVLTPLKWRASEGEKLNQLSVSQRSVQYEKEYIRKDGTTIPIELTVAAKFDPNGNIIHYTGFISDITERKQAEIALHDLAARQQALLTAIPDIIMETDENKRYTWANQSGLDFFGNDVVGKEAAFYFEADQNTYEIVEPLFSGKENVIYLESWQRRKDGQKRLLAWWCHVLKDDDGQVIGALSSARDITEQHQNKEQLHLLNTELEKRVTERTAELEAFAYSVSHDLKAPLRGIDGYSHLLLDDYADKLDEEGRFFLHTIRQAAQQMKQLIEDLLEYSRMQRRTLEIKTVNPLHLVEALLSERASEIEEQGITIEVNVPCTSVTAEVDGLAQVLRNLLDNAIKFSSGVPAPRIEIGGRGEENTCILWVRDNGVGFDPKYQDRIFEIFQRLHSPEEYPGTGIGLAIVRQGMKRLNGRVWSESKLGEGAVFYIEIPKAQVEE